MNMRRKNDQRGQALLEFVFSLSFLVPLLLGVWVFGSRLVELQALTQITRDVGHMYNRGVDFSCQACTATQTGPDGNAQTLASGFNLTPTGTSVLILSEIEVETQAMCTAAVGNGACPNKNNPVFVQQIAIGNLNDGSSYFGTPVSGGSLTTATALNSGLGYYTNVSITAQANQAYAAVNSSFNSSVLNLTSVGSGTIAYMVEMINKTPTLSVPGMTGSPIVYSRAIF
jgi:hypothetical protein